MSPLWKAGAIDSDTTHIIGVDELVTKLSPFHIMNNVLRCRSKGRNSARDCRRPVDFVDDIVSGISGCGQQLIHSQYSKSAPKFIGYRLRLDVSGLDSLVQSA